MVLALSYLLLLVPANINAYAFDMESEPSVEATSVTEELPSEYCLRDDYIVYAQNQDSHGYCWNFASTMAASTTLMKATGEYYDFSEAWVGVALYNQTKQFSKMGQGGSFSYHYNAMKVSGLMLETDLPYQDSYAAVNENAADYYNFFEQYSNDALANTLVSDADTRFKTNEIDRIKSHIYNHGSVYLAFTFRTGFVESDGVYYLEPNQKNTTSSHAVSVIGWDDNFEREVYLNGSSTPTVYKGAWLILNSYTEKSGNDGVSLIFYDDANINTVQGYRYDPDTSGDLYFYDKIESGFSYPTTVKGKYYGDCVAKITTTKQKNIFLNDVNLEYSYTASKGAEVEGVDIYLDGQNVTKDFKVNIDNKAKRFSISKAEAEYGQYKVIVTYGNGKKSDTYLNNFFVTHGLVGEEIEFDYANNSLAFNTGRDLEFYSFASSDKQYVIYTDSLSGKISFTPTERSVYSSKNMSLSDVFYDIVNGNSCISTYIIKSDSGYELDYNFIFEYYEDRTLQPVNVYYDLDGGVNNKLNYDRELASPTTDLVLYEPTRPGYTFAGWYLDYGKGSRKVSEVDDLHYISWDDITHLGENPGTNALNYYKNYYNNSNTLFVYAHWEEIDYYNIDISITGEGNSQISNSISVGAGESVKYMLRPKSGWCLSKVKINGKAVSSSEVTEIATGGLEIKDIHSDISIEVTFSEGTYLHIASGENIKSAYVIGTVDGKTSVFYDGDVIPPEYFKNSFQVNDKVENRFDDLVIPSFDKLKDPNLNDIFDPNFDNIYDPDKKDDIFSPDDKDDVPTFDNIIDIEDYEDLISNLYFEGSPVPGIKDETVDDSGFSGVFIPAGSSQFSLVVELEKERPGCKYVLDDLDSYTQAGDGIYTKNVVIGGSNVFKKIDVGSAVRMVEISYSVNSYALDHYLSTDANAESGSKNIGVYSEGQLVYLFIKLPSNTYEHRYTLPKEFESVGDGWYRMTITADISSAVMGEIVVRRDIQTYTVSWNDWDGSLIYSETYSYGDLPVFRNPENASSAPIRISDGVYEYSFCGWDKDISVVNSDAIYTATYDAELIKYSIHVEYDEYGSVTSNGSDFITYQDVYTYTFTPNDGFVVSDVILNGESLGPLSSYTFFNVCGDQTLRVEFEKVKYLVNVIVGDNGISDVSGTTQVEHGGNLSINITPNDLFDIDYIKVNGVAFAVSQKLIVDNVTQNTVVEIAFKQIRFNVTSSCSTGGSVTPSMTLSIGESARIDFIPDTGYRVKDVIIDGVSVGVVDYYSFVNVNQDHTVYVEYELNITLIVVASVVIVILIGSAVAIPLVIKSRKANESESDGKSPTEDEAVGSKSSDTEK